MAPRTPTLAIFALIGAVTFLLYSILTPPNFSYKRFISGMSQTQWSSPYSAYLQRADPQPDFTPTRSALQLAVLRNSPVEPEGFTLALFSPLTAIDAKGHVYTLQQGDYEGILAIAERVKLLPNTGGFRNTWRVLHDTTSKPIDRVLSPKTALGDAPSSEGYEAEYVETSVYGFDKTRRQLKEPVDEYTELPDELWELTGLAWEARETSGERDELALQKVRAVLVDAL
ncbi:unnamed protein product [Cyclocybe aegerita]|uniref:Uncharacterized protein n=1 Tax=Cyclocybe aegerita TaxID=1973307 RepID=A0A8S0WS12_CYCAE|nr:unnamed protein product [Cyclocybe aegerita]